MPEGLNAGTAFLDILPRVGPEFGAALETEVAGPLARMRSLGTALGTALKVGIGAGLVAVPIALFEIGKSFDEAFDTIRVETGKTGAALEGLEESTKGILTDVPTSIGAAGDAVAGLNQKLGLTGGPLRDVADRLLELSRMTGTDLATNLGSVSELFVNFGISAGDQAGKLDELFRVSQATGVGVADLASAMASGGAVFRQVGLTFEQSAALVGLFGRAGVSATAALAPFSRAVATAAKEGKSATDVLSETFAAIRNAPNDTAAAGAAIEVFGARSGPRLAGLIREGKISYEELAATIAAGGDTILGASEDTQDAGEKMRLAWNRILVAVEPAAAAVFAFVGEMAEKLGPALTVVFDKIGEAWRAVVDGFKGSDEAGAPVGRLESIFRTIGEVVRGIVDPVKSFLYTLRTGFTEDEGTPIERFALLVRDVLLPALKDVAAFVQEHAKPILIGLGLAIAALAAPILTAVGTLVYLYVRFSAVRTAVAGAIAGVQAFVDFISDDVVPVVERVVEYVAEQFGHLVDATSERWGAITEAIGHVLRALEVAIAVFLAPIIFIWTQAHDQILAVVGVVWDQIRLAIETAIRIIRDVIDVVLSLINGDWGQAWNAIKDLAGAVWDFIVGLVGNAISAVSAVISGGLAVIQGLWSAAWNAVKTMVSAVWDGIKSVVSGGINAVVGFVTGLPGRIASAVSGAFSAIPNGFRSAINALIDIWNNFHISFGGFDIPGPGPNIPGFTIDTPNIPHLAAGGTTRTAGFAIVGDPGSPELVALPAGATVVPLDVAGMIADAAKTTDSDRPVEVVVNLDGYEVARGLVKPMRRLERGKKRG